MFCVARVPCVVALKGCSIYLHLKQRSPHFPDTVACISFVDLCRCSYIVYMQLSAAPLVSDCTSVVNFSLVLPAMSA